MDRLATIKVKRKNNLAAFMRPYKIYIDDKRMDSLMGGQEVDLQVGEGRHRIDIVYSLWIKSDLLQFEVQDGDTLTFECGFEYKHFVRYMLAVIAASFCASFLAMTPAPQWLVLVVTPISIILTPLFLAMTFKRGFVCYLKEIDPGQH